MAYYNDHIHFRASYCTRYPARPNSWINAHGQEMLYKRVCQTASHCQRVDVSWELQEAHRTQPPDLLCQASVFKFARRCGRRPCPPPACWTRLVHASRVAKANRGSRFGEVELCDRRVNAGNVYDQYHALGATTELAGRTLSKDVSKSRQGSSGVFL